MLTLKPRDIDTSGIFLASGWRNNEIETVALKIVKTCARLNPDEWVPFSPKDIGEDNIYFLDLLAHGGRLATISGPTISEGNLLEHENGTYSVTQQFINMLPNRAKLR